MYSTRVANEQIVEQNCTDLAMGQGQWQINHRADGACARGPPAEGPPTICLRQHDLVMGHGTCWSLLREALPKREVGDLLSGRIVRRVVAVVTYIVLSDRGLSFIGHDEHIGSRQNSNFRCHDQSENGFLDG